MKKIFVLLLAILCIGAMFVSCGEDFDAAEWSEDNEKTKRSASYKELNDEKFYEIDVDGKITVNVNVKTVSGDAFFAEIYNSKTPNSPVYSLVIYKTEDGSLEAVVNYGGEETKTVLESNTYSKNITVSGNKDDFVIHIKGQNHTGSFSFDW